jgi:hypothetical protein
MVSYELAQELLAVINRLRDKELFRPLVVLEEHLTAMTCMRKGYILNTIGNLPFVGVVDEGSHISRHYGDTDASIFAGHIGALTTERLRLLANAHGFMSHLRERAVLQKIKEEIIPTTFERLLASDLELEGVVEQACPMSRCTEVYLPSAPLTIEVVDAPEVEASNSWDINDEESKLKLTGVLKPQQEGVENDDDQYDDQSEWY